MVVFFEVVFVLLVGLFICLFVCSFKKKLLVEFNTLKRIFFENLENVQTLSFLTSKKLIFFYIT